MKLLELRLHYEGEGKSPRKTLFQEDTDGSSQYFLSNSVHLGHLGGSKSPCII